MGMTSLVMFGSLFAFAQSANAAVNVNSLACARLNIGDGSTADWFQRDIPFLVRGDGASIEGTTYYYNGTSEEWEETESEDTTLSVNMDQWLDVLSMKFCTTGGDMRMYAKTVFPMMMVYNYETESYQSVHEPVSFDEFDEPTFLTMPAALDGWMVWKMQLADNPTERPIYFAANITVPEVSLEEVENVNIGLYRESDTRNFDRASFNPNEDRLLVDVETTDGCSDEEDCGGEDATSTRNVGFEVEQDITEIYRRTEITPRDNVRIEMATYDTSDFSDASGLGFSVASDTTNAKTLQFAKVGPRNLQAVAVKRKSTRLRWNLKRRQRRKVKKYQVRVFNANGRKIMQKKVVGLQKKRRKIKVRGLRSGRTYTAVVRAVRKNKSKTAWSSAVRWNTN